MPRFYHRGFGHASATPPQLAELPLDALRSQLYPVYADAPDAIAAQQGKPLPIGLPQRMMFTRWKSGALATQWAENARGYVSARDYGAQHSGVLQDAAGIPPVRMSPASFASQAGATALTVQTINPDIDRTPISQGYLPPNAYITANDLSNFVANDEASRKIAQQDRALRANTAIQEANAVRRAVFARMGEQPRPWYARR